MSDFEATLGPTQIGAELLVRLARQRASGLLVWSTSDAKCELQFCDGRPERVAYQGGAELTDRAQIVGALRAVAVTNTGSCSFVSQAVVTTGVNVDTLGEVLVAVMNELKPVQLDGMWRARGEAIVDSHETFNRFGSAIAAVGGPTLRQPPAGTPLGLLVGEADLPTQRAWAAMLALGGVTAPVANTSHAVVALPVPKPQPAEPKLPTARVDRVRGEAVQVRGKVQPEGVSNRPTEAKALKLYLEVNKAFKRFENADHYEMLGVPRDVAKGDVRKAYFDAAKLWHSDRFAGAGLDPEILQKAEALFRKAEEAHTVLGDEQARDEYDFIMEREAQGLPTDPRVIFEAENMFHKAHMLVRRGQPAAAEPILREAVKLNKGEPEFLVYLGFAVYSVKGTEGLDEARGMIREALAANPRFDEAHEFLGRIARVEGDNLTAKREFEEALKINPKNVEAERELRLLTMRKSKKESKKDGIQGLLGKVLKR